MLTVLVVCVYKAIQGFTPCAYFSLMLRRNSKQPYHYMHELDGRQAGFDTEDRMNDAWMGQYSVDASNEGHEPLRGGRGGGLNGAIELRDRMILI
ncbi:hypothetical protein M408DRAFT_172769 [Serendipita vermifera MAFF 305830]|uniref:Uncharacterized protein n=1 Tax=Serendipita vermifera MAFF 305830 TaxID=933852 RepID=A0A0C3B6D4_SERVB|nr:hypothetical protein M408DRAFT_172769 [Serendipita vermifera MAFF 305830]